MAMGNWLSDPATRTALLAIWALGALTLLPFAWGWRDGWMLGDSDEGVEFTFGHFFFAILWPMIFALPLALVSLAIGHGWDKAHWAVRDWWARDWA